MSDPASTPEPNTPEKSEASQEKGFPFPEIPSLRDVFVGELASNGRWVVANVDTTGSWPIRAQKIQYRGEDVWLIPLTKECYGGLAIKVRHGLDVEACQKLLMRLLSAISWVYEQGNSLAYGFSGGNLPRPLGRRNQNSVGSIMTDFDLSYCPEPANDKALLAMALMREGRALGHPGYAFLSFYRVLEVAIPNGPQRGQWIAAKIPMLSGHFAKPAVDKLVASGVQDIAIHLREANRHAIAHAAADPVIDPDDPVEARRLSQETPIIVELATLAIEEFFGVETRTTQYRKHLYELVGFKAVIGEDVVARIVAGEVLPEGMMVTLPEINIGLRDRPPTSPLVNFKLREVQQHEKSLVALYENERVIMQIGLNFGEERLDFEMMRDMRIRDDGTADGMAAIIEYTKFLNALFLNGQLHVYDADSGELLGRKDAYMPMNMIFDSKKADAELNRFAIWGRARRELESGGWKVSRTTTFVWDFEKSRPLFARMKNSAGD